MNQARRPGQKVSGLTLLLDGGVESKDRNDTLAIAVFSHA